CLFITTLHRVDICHLFFFQAEDGIRDRNVTGVQTCALPILDADAQLETPQSKADLIWHEIQNAYRTRKILTGKLGGIEKTEAGKIGRASCRERGESWVGCVAEERNRVRVGKRRIARKV